MTFALLVLVAIAACIVATNMLAGRASDMSFARPQSEREMDIIARRMEKRIGKVASRKACSYASARLGR